MIFNNELQIQIIFIKFTVNIINQMNTRFFTIIIIILGYASFCVAAPPPNPPSGSAASAAGHPGCWPPPCIPIDGGISLLIAAGAIYGGRKLYSNQKEKNSL